MNVKSCCFADIKPLPSVFQFTLPLPASLLKFPIVVIQKFCYHGNMTSHLSSLLGRMKVY